MKHNKLITKLLAFYEDYQRWDETDEDQPTRPRVVQNLLLFSLVTMPLLSLFLGIRAFGWMLILFCPLAAFDAWGAAMTRGRPALAWRRAAVLVTVGWAIGGYIVANF